MQSTFPIGIPKLEENEVCGYYIWKVPIIKHTISVKQSTQIDLSGHVFIVVNIVYEYILQQQ